MNECDYCQHVEMCRWRKELEERGCDFFDDGNKWIPVSERLPEERKAVLVYAPEYKNIYCAYLDGDTWFIFGGYGSYAVANVIAWMPLPEPYKAESEG